MPFSNHRNSVVIIEPDHATRVELRQIFEKQNFFVMSFTKGTDFFEIMKNTSTPSAIIISGELLYMNPEDVINTVNSDPKYNTTELFLITDGAKSIDTTKLSGVFRKPIEESEILNALLRE